MCGHVLTSRQSGAWEDNGVFVYTTLNHIKYVLPNGQLHSLRFKYSFMFACR